MATPVIAPTPPPTAAPIPAPRPPPAIAPITAPVPAPTKPPPNARSAGLYGSANAVVANIRPAPITPAIVECFLMCSTHNSRTQATDCCVRFRSLALLSRLRRPSRTTIDARTVFSVGGARPPCGSQSNKRPWRSRLRVPPLFSGATSDPSAREGDRPGRIRKPEERPECTRSEKAPVRVAGLKRLQPAERYVFRDARARRLYADPTVFGHERLGKYGYDDAHRCDGRSNFLPVYRLPSVEGTLATRLAWPDSVLPAAVAIRLPAAAWAEAEAATGRSPSGPLGYRPARRLQVTALSRKQRGSGGRPSSPKPLPWRRRQKKREYLPTFSNSRTLCRDFGRLQLSVTTGSPAATARWLHGRACCFA